MIDVTQYGTFPPEIEAMFLRYVDEFPSNVITEITSKNVENSTDVKCAIEKYLNPFHAEALYKEMLSCFNETTLRCFHATKILSESDIQSKGLLVNSWDQYSVALKTALLQTDLSEQTIKDAICCVEHECQGKNRCTREPQVCFFSSMSMADGGESAGYDQFCQNVGGELARWALKYKMPNAYKALKPIGIPVIVEFELPFSDITYYKKENIVYWFVTYYSAKKFWGREYPIEFDGSTGKDVLPSQIIKIHRYREVDYE